MKKDNFSKHFWITAALSLVAIFSFAQNQENTPLAKLKEGNMRFTSDKSEIKHQDMARVNELKSGQSPFAIIVSCSDSRVAPEIVFDQGLGDIFSIRTAGNIMADYEEGSIEYAAEHLKSKLIVVMGHTSCGAVKAFMELKHGHGEKDKSKKHKEELGHIKAIVEKLHSEKEEKEVFSAEGTDTYNRAIKANVVNGVKQLRNSKPFLHEMYKKDEIQIVGAIYHIETGEVEFLDI